MMHYLHKNDLLKMSDDIQMYRLLHDLVHMDQIHIFNPNVKNIHVICLILQLTFL